MTDRRSETRFVVGKAVTVTVLSPPADPSSDAGTSIAGIAATIEQVSTRGMRLLLDRRLPVDAAVRIDLDDGLWLGEVRYSVPVDGKFGVGIEFRHCLRNLAELLQVRERFIGSAPATGVPRNAR